MKKLLLLLVLFLSGCCNYPPKNNSPSYVVLSKNRSNLPIYIYNECILINDIQQYYIVQYIDWPYHKVMYDKEKFDLVAIVMPSPEDSK